MKIEEMAAKKPYDEPELTGITFFEGDVIQTSNTNISVLPLAPG